MINVTNQKHATFYLHRCSAIYQHQIASQQTGCLALSVATVLNERKQRTKKKKIGSQKKAE